MGGSESRLLTGLAGDIGTGSCLSCCELTGFIAIGRGVAALSDAMFGGDKDDGG